MITYNNFLIGLECPRCFWNAINKKEDKEISEQHEQRIDNSKKVSDLVKSLYNDYVDLSKVDFNTRLKLTKNAITERRTVFNAVIKNDYLYAKVDILKPNTDGTWEIFQISSGNSVKDNKIQGLAFQKYGLGLENIAVSNCYVIHLNGNYVKAGDLELKKLFKIENVTNEVNEFVVEVPKILETLFSIKELKEEPRITAEKYLLKDYPCEFDSQCWSALPKHNVTKLYKINKKKAASYIKEGVVKIIDLPKEKLNANQKIQWEAIKASKIHLDKVGINQFLSTLKYPYYYFDFETFSEPIPRFDNTKPYSQIPFQFSLHVQEEDGTIIHHEFLHQSNDDPRKTILEDMKQKLGESGSVIVYNQTFEKTRLKELAQVYPEYKEWVENILSRIVDLLQPFSSFNYYNPMQEGSCSIKKVLPAITGYSYDELDIGNGGDASTLYFQATYEEKFSSEERTKIYNDLLEYCKLDTKGMVLIVEELKKLVNG